MSLTPLHPTLRVGGGKGGRGTKVVGGILYLSGRRSWLPCGSATKNYALIGRILIYSITWSDGVDMGHFPHIFRVKEFLHFGVRRKRLAQIT